MIATFEYPTYVPPSVSVFVHGWPGEFPAVWIAQDGEVG